MPRPLFASGVLLLGATVVALGGCGSSNTTSSGAGAGQAVSTPTPTSAGSDSGSSFCVRAAAAVAQLAHINAGFTAVTPGATPSVTSIKQLFATADSAIDSMDSSLPSQISASFTTLRTAYDQANSRVQAATTFQEISTAVSGLADPSLTTADDQIKSYLQTTCGISTPTP